MDGEPCFSWRVFGSCSQSWTCIPSMLFKAGLHSWFESNYCVTECICLYIREIHMQMHVCQRINYIEQHRTSIQIIPIRYTVYIQYIVIYCVYDYIYIHIQHIYIYICVYHSLSASLLSLELCGFLLSTVGFPQHCTRGSSTIVSSFWRTLDLWSYGCEVLDRWVNNLSIIWWVDNR